MGWVGMGFWVLVHELIHELHELHELWKGLVVFGLRFGGAWGWVRLRPVSHSCCSPRLCKNSAIRGNNEELGGEVTGMGSRISRNFKEWGKWGFGPRNCSRNCSRNYSRNKRIYTNFFITRITLIEDQWS